MFKYKTQIKLHDTDAAGIIFFANQFVIIHDAYELVLEKFHCDFKTMLTKRSYFLPIVHAESDYKKPLHVGDHIVVGVTLGHIGHSSFSFEYTIKRGLTLVGTAKTVHVTINKKTSQKIALPAAFRRGLERFAKAK